MSTGQEDRASRGVWPASLLGELYETWMAIRAPVHSTCATAAVAMRGLGENVTAPTLTRSRSFWVKSARTAVAALGARRLLRASQAVVDNPNIQNQSKRESRISTAT